MRYVCIEDGKIINILNYQPNVPKSVTVQVISADEEQTILNKTHYFDITSMSVIPLPDGILEQINQDKLNQSAKLFLSNSDWKVLRHLRELALNIPTSITQDEYLQLESERASIAASIVK